MGKKKKKKKKRGMMRLWTFMLVVILFREVLAADVYEGTTCEQEEYQQTNAGGNHGNSGNDGIAWKTTPIKCPTGDDPENWIVSVQQTAFDQMPAVLCANLPGVTWEITNHRRRAMIYGKLASFSGEQGGMHFDGDRRRRHADSVPCTIGPVEAERQGGQYITGDLNEVTTGSP